VPDSKKDELEALIRNVKAAREADDYARTEELKQALENFSAFDAALNDRAHEALVAARVADLAAAAAQLKALADGLSGAGEALARARAAAQSGQKNLIIPRIASASERILDEAQILRAGVQRLIDAGGEVDSITELAGFLDNMMAEAKNALERARQIDV
jgi:hypothetical protein